MQTVPLASFANADQSGFLKEMHSVRSHAPVGERKVIRIIQSLAAILHSFTILPVLFANGTLAEKLFIIMQEPGGKFPRRGHFITPNGNFVVRAGTTHIMTKNQMLDWFSSCVLVPSTPSKIVLLVDSWPAFKDHAAIAALVPPGKELEVHNIPAGATSFIQPLDVYFFRPFKAVVKRITSHVLAHDIPFVVHQRDNILKVISLVYWTFCAPYFRPFLQYPWKAARYTNTHLVPFLTPPQVCFPQDLSGVCEETKDAKTRNKRAKWAKAA